MKILGLAIQDVGPYEEKATFKVKPGLSVIYGLNRTTGQQSKNSNWVGKSLLFSTLSDVLYEEPIIGTKQDTVKKGLQQILMEDDEGHKLLISKKNNKYIIKKDGESVDFVTNKKGPRQYIESVWPISLEEYETFVHLDTRVPHPLVMGSTAIRKDFFTKFFGLDKVDAERKLYLAELHKLDSVKAAYEQTASTYALLKKDALSEEEIEELEQSLVALSEKKERLQAKLDKEREKQQIIEFGEMYAKEIKKLQSLDLLDTNAIDDAINDLDKKIKKTSKMRRVLAEFEQSLYLRSAYDQAYAKLSDDAKSCSFEKAKEGSRRYTIIRQDYDDQQRIIKRFETNWPIAIEKLAQPDGNYEEIKEELSSAEYALNNAQKFGTGKCPTCGQPVSVDIDSLQAKVDELEEKVDAWKKYRSRLQRYEAFIEDQARANTAKQKSDELAEKLEKYAKYQQIYKELSALPEEPEDVEDPGYSRSELEAVLEQAKDDRTFLYRMRSTIAKVNQYLSLEDKTIDTTLQDRYNKLSEKYFTEKSNLENAKSALEKRKQIQAKMIEMQEQLKDVKPLEHLVDLFQDKTLKKRIVQIIGNRLMTLVNKYAAVVFTEDYKFSLEWESSQINLICKRKAGSKELVSDVRKLSGAESRLFTLILVLALLSFVPQNKRPNLLILDEPDSNFSNETTQSFIKLMSLLSQVIESIVVITTSEDIYPNSHCYTIVRDKTSRIVEKHPSEVK